MILHAVAKDRIVRVAGHGMDPRERSRRVPLVPFRADMGPSSTQRGVTRLRNCP